MAALAEKHPELGIKTETFDRLEEHPHANTRIRYLYRDASNYKQSDSVIFSGAITAEECETLIAHFDEYGGFIPGQVGMPDLQDRMTGGWDEDLDHPFHEITGIELTLSPADTSMTAADLADRFSGISWDPEHRP